MTSHDRPTGVAASSHDPASHTVTAANRQHCSNPAPSYRYTAIDGTVRAGLALGAKGRTRRVAGPLCALLDRPEPRLPATPLLMLYSRPA